MSAINNVIKLESAFNAAFPVAEQSTLVRKLYALSTVATANQSLDEQFIKAQSLLNRSPSKALARKVTGLRIGSRDDLSTFRKDSNQGSPKPGQRAPLTHSLENLKKFILDNQDLILSVQTFRSQHEYAFDDALSDLQQDHAAVIKAFANLNFTPSYDAFDLSESWLYITDDDKDNV